MNNLFSVNSKVALVTGGSRGLGFTICEALLLAGAARVYVSSRKSDACDSAIVTLNKLMADHHLPGVAIPAPADTSTDEGIKRLLEFVESRESKLDIVVANAGTTWGATFGEHPGSAIDKVLALNVKGVFLTIQAFTPLLEKAGIPADPSRVLVTGSVAGIVSGLSGGAYGYLASKAAIHHLVRTLAAELGPNNITVNALAPGFFPTKMTNKLLDVIGDEATEVNPRGRLGEPQDIMGAVIYLCSQAGNYINGVILPIDGGVHVTSRF